MKCFDPQGGLNDQRETIALVVSIAAEQPNALAVPLDGQSIAIMFDLADPVGRAERIGRCGAKCDSETAPAEV